MRILLKSTILFFLLNSISVVASDSLSPYPNELRHFKFYKKYLAPLVPYASGTDLVMRVLGSDKELELKRWRVFPLFVGSRNTTNGHAWAEDVSGLLARVEVKPKQRISMLGVKFPPAFTHSFGSVSEINVSCDVYSDRFGLEYWIYSEDSAAGKKDDLAEIIYGPAVTTERAVVSFR